MLVGRVCFFILIIYLSQFIEDKVEFLLKFVKICNFTIWQVANAFVWGSLIFGFRVPRFCVGRAFNYSIDATVLFSFL